MYHTVSILAKKPVSDMPVWICVFRLNLSRRKLRLVSHRMDNDSRRLSGYIAQSAIVEVDIDRRGRALTVSEQPPDDG